MKILGALLVLMYATCPVAGFAAEDVTKVSYKNMIRLNSLNVTKITTGMTKDEVVQIMGNIQSKVRNGVSRQPSLDRLDR